MSNTRVADGLTPGLNAVGDGLTAPPGVPVPGIPTEWQTESDNGDQETKDEVDKTKDTGDKVKDAEDEIRDDDEEGKKNLDGIGTELSSDSSSGEGTPKVYPASNQTPQQSMPQQSMPQQSMPQMSMPQASMPQVSTPSTPTMSKDLFDKLAGNYSPDKGNSSSNSGSSSKFNDPNGVNKSKLDPSEVDINKKGYGVLSTGELETVMDKALDANGITDEKAREQWKDVLKYMAIKESGLNADAVNTYDCVPVDNAILTQRGWLKHDEVRVGDLTLGYNFSTKHSEWTPITNVVHHENALVTHLSNSRWDAVVTPEHKWVVEPRLFRKDIIGAYDLSASKCPKCDWKNSHNGNSVNKGLRTHLGKKHGVKSVPVHYKGDAQYKVTRDLNTRDSIILAAPARTESKFDITLVEAELLGWIAGDGHVENRKHRPTISIAQSKPNMVERLKELLKEIPHSEYTDYRRTRLGRKPVGARHQFRIKYEWAQDLMRRVGNPKADAVSIVLGMSSEERTAWLRGIFDAEGTVSKTGQRTISQCYGSVLDAIIVATYMSGRRPAVHDQKRAEPSWNALAIVDANIPRVHSGGLKKEDGKYQSVWCVTTELGSWTCRNGEHVFLTGNSNAHGATAADGNPFNCSRGIWQTIPTTFAAYHVSGTSAAIYDPVASGAAAINYISGKYNVDKNGGASLDAFYARRGGGGGSYTGY